MRRLVLLAAALAFGSLGASAVPAYAEETPPPPRSSPGDPFGGQSLPPGPIYVITPGGPAATGLPAPADPSVVEEAIRQDAEKNGTPGATPTAQPSAAASGTPSVGVTPGSPTPPGAATTESAGAPGTGTEAAGSTSAVLWWVTGAGVLVAAVVALIVVRRRRDRLPGDSLTDHAP